MGEEKQIHLNEYQKAAVLDESPACVVNARRRRSWMKVRRAW